MSRNVTESLADDIGRRIREARTRLGLTQGELAGDRYTKAYVSALENGRSKPSMDALAYLAGRLGVPPARFLSEEPLAWRRLEADVRLAAGEWSEALIAYRDLLEDTSDPVDRASLHLGCAEALCRLERGAEAVAPASAAAEGFALVGRFADWARATYWLAGAQYERGNSDEARALVQDVLAQVRSGLHVDPDFRHRLLLALAMIDSKDGEHSRALGYLQEAGELAADVDDRSRAAVLYSMAVSYRDAGDIEGAIRTGMQSLALFRAAGRELETASTENDLALTYLKLGNLDRAREYAADARARLEPLGDLRWLAHVTETQAQVALAQGLLSEARGLAHAAGELAEQSGNHKALVSALLTRARAEVAGDALGDASATLEEAARLARSEHRRVLLRDVLTEWAAVYAALGQHARAYELTREALAETS